MKYEASNWILNVVFLYIIWHGDSTDRGSQWCRMLGTKEEEKKVGAWWAGHQGAGSAVSALLQPLATLVGEHASETAIDKSRHGPVSQV